MFSNPRGTQLDGRSHHIGIVHPLLGLQVADVVLGVDELPRAEDTDEADDREEDQTQLEVILQSDEEDCPTQRPECLKASGRDSIPVPIITLIIWMRA